MWWLALVMPAFGRPRQDLWVWGYRETPFQKTKWEKNGKYIFRINVNYSISEGLKAFHCDISEPFSVTHFESWKQKFSQALPPILASQKGEGPCYGGGGRRQDWGKMWLRGGGTGAWPVCLRPEPAPSLQQIKIASFFHGKSVLRWRPELLTQLL